MENFKSGFITIIGRSSVGKSTLLNSLVNEHISITSPKKETTRRLISGICTTSEYQMIFTDTPGIHRPKDGLGSYINNLSVSAINGVDVIIHMVSKTYSKAEDYVIKHYKEAKLPVILVINKIDRLKSKVKIDEIILSYIAVFEYCAVIPISAYTKKNIDHLKAEILKFLPHGPLYYDEKALTNQQDDMEIAELIRENIISLTKEEVPSSVNVYVENNDNFNISAVIAVIRKSQKGIIIGDHGQMIKEIRKRSRKSIDSRFNCKCQLELWVKVIDKWRNNMREIKRVTE